MVRFEEALARLEEARGRYFRYLRASSVRRLAHEDDEMAESLYDSAIAARREVDRLIERSSSLRANWLTAMTPSAARASVIAMNDDWCGDRALRRSRVEERAIPVTLHFENGVQLTI